MKGCSSTYRSFKQFMESINKYVKRAVIDIQYYLNSAILDTMSSPSSPDHALSKVPDANVVNGSDKAGLELRASLSTFLKESEEYLAFYEDKLKRIFENL